MILHHWSQTSGIFWIKIAIILAILSVVIMLSANLFMNLYKIGEEIKYYAWGFIGHQFSLILIIVALVFVTIEFCFENQKILKPRKK